jgi:hypothetical protein
VGAGLARGRAGAVGRGPADPPGVVDLQAVVIDSQPTLVALVAGVAALQLDRPAPGRGPAPGRRAGQRIAPAHLVELVRLVGAGLSRGRAGAAGRGLADPPGVVDTQASGDRQPAAWSSCWPPSQAHADPQACARSRAGAWSTHWPADPQAGACSSWCASVARSADRIAPAPACARASGDTRGAGDRRPADLVACASRRRQIRRPAPGRGRAPGRRAGHADRRLAQLVDTWSSCWPASRRCRSAGLHQVVGVHLVDVLAM